MPTRKISGAVGKIFSKEYCCNLFRLLPEFTANNDFMVHEKRDLSVKWSFCCQCGKENNIGISLDNRHIRSPFLLSK
jgi:hypothetical protein